MLGSVYKHKAELATILATAVTYGLSTLDTEQSIPISFAPTAGFILSYIICKISLSRHIKKQKDECEQKKSDYLTRVKEVAEIVNHTDAAKSAQNADLIKSLLDPVTKILNDDAARILQEEDKIQKLIAESERLDDDALSKLK